MSASTKLALKSLLRGIAWLLFAVAGLSFWMGGRVIGEFAKTERTLAEIEGIGLALACAGLGAVAKVAGGKDEANAPPTSEGEQSRR
jgi:hypothetical protein